MAAYCLSKPLLDLFKLRAREDFPDVKHSHLIEAFARGFGFNTWAALNAYLNSGSASPNEWREFSTDAMKERLVSIGYEESPAWPSFFGIRDLATLNSIRSELYKRECAYWTLEELVLNRMISRAQCEQLILLVERRATILVTGESYGGSRTMMKALLHERAIRSPLEKFGWMNHGLETEGMPANVLNLREPLKESTLVIEDMVAERRYDRRRIDDVLSNWAVRAGGLGVISADSAKQAMETLKSLAPGRPELAQTIDAVVHTGEEFPGPFIREIHLVNGEIEPNIVLRPEIGGWDAATVLLISARVGIPLKEARKLTEKYSATEMVLASRDTRLAQEDGTLVDAPHFFRQALAERIHKKARGTSEDAKAGDIANEGAWRWGGHAMAAATVGQMTDEERQQLSVLSRRQMQPEDWPSVGVDRAGLSIREDGAIIRDGSEGAIGWLKDGRVMWFEG